MTLKKNDIVYGEINGVPTQCMIIACGFGGDDSYLVTSLIDKQSFIANITELSETAEECQKNYEKMVYDKYHLYYDTIKTETDLILHLMDAGVNGRQINGIELKAVTDRASEFTQINVAEYLDRINADKKKNEVVEDESKECA